MTPSAKRSLTEPNGLKASILTNRLTSGGASLPMRTTGVLPIVSRILPYLLPILFVLQCRRPTVPLWAPSDCARLHYPYTGEISRESAASGETHCAENSRPTPPDPSPGQYRSEIVA